MAPLFQYNIRTAFALRRKEADPGGSIRVHKPGLVEIGEEKDVSGSTAVSVTDPGFPTGVEPLFKGLSTLNFTQRKF